MKTADRFSAAVLVLLSACARPPCPISDVSRDLLLPGMKEAVVAPRKKAWEDALGGQAAARPYIRDRLAGWPGRLLADRAGLPRDDREFAWRAARDTWSGLAAFTDREHGLPIDNVRFGSAAADLATARIGDYTSGTDIGLYLTAVVAARDLGIIGEVEGIERARAVLETLQRLETHAGFLFNYYDTTSLERTSNFVSFVDASWLTAGLIMVRSAFPSLGDRCTRLVDQTDYGFFYDRRTRRVSHGYYVKPGLPSPFDYGVLYSEARLGILIAIGKGDIPEDAWFALWRVFPSTCAWQPLVPQVERTKYVRGRKVGAGYYEWKGVRFVPSWGGSQFEALMPALVLDEARYAPRSLGANGRAHAEVQKRYAAEELGYPVWGISSCATPAADGYAEHGVKVLGTRGYEAGAVTPHASALALGLLPAEAIANLRLLAERYDIYGEFGFYDAVDPRTGAVAHSYLALDQAMTFVALANHLCDRCVQRRFAADPIVQAALPVIAAEDFFD